jgi:hypothetical protein
MAALFRDSSDGLVVRHFISSSLDEKHPPPKV